MTLMVRSGISTFVFKFIDENKTKNEANEKHDNLSEYRECFYLFARNGHIRTLDELTMIMRSLGSSPTIAELNKYLTEKGLYIKKWNKHN